MLNFSNFSRSLPFLFFLGLGLGLSGPLAAQEAKQGTPREALETHLKFLQPEFQNSRAKRRAYLNLSAKVMANPDLPLETEDRRRRAQMLKEIYEGLGKYMDYERITDNPNHTDSTFDNPNTFLVVSHLGYDVALEKVGKNWYYSKETIAKIPSLYSAVFLFDPQATFGIDLFDPPQTFLLVTAWQYAGLAALGLVLLVLYLVLHLLLLRWPTNRLKKRGYSTKAEEFYVALVRPLIMFVVLVGGRYLLPILQLPIEITRYLYPLLHVLMVVQLTRTVYNLVNVLGYYTEKRSGNWAVPVDQQLAVLIKRIFRIMVVIAGGAYLLQYLGLNITSVVAGLSLGGLALALAAQDTLKNVFGSLMIFMDKPFKVGDWIIGDKIEGEVESVGFRSTRVRTFQNSLTSVPNGKIADMTIDNMGMRNFHRFLTTISVTYDTPAHLLERYVEAMREVVRRHPLTIKDNFQIFIFNFGDSAIQLRYSVYIGVNEVLEEMAVRQELMLHNIRLAEVLGVRFAFPTTTVHVESTPDQPAMLRSRTNESDHAQKIKEYLAQYGPFPVSIGPGDEVI
jgi:MscS family membrane protein